MPIILCTCSTFCLIFCQIHQRHGLHEQIVVCIPSWTMSYRLNIHCISSSWSRSWGGQQSKWFWPSEMELYTNQYYNYDICDIPVALAWVVGGVGSGGWFCSCSDLFSHSWAHWHCWARDLELGAVIKDCKSGIKIIPTNTIIMTYVTYLQH